MKYNIININTNQKTTFTNLCYYLGAEENLLSNGYKKLTTLKRKSCVNTYFYKESEE